VAAEGALQEGDKRTAGQLITLAVNSEDRASFLQEKAEQLVGVSEDMKAQVKEADAELEDAKTVVDQIRWHAQVAEAYKDLYEITSEVSADGFSAQGSLKQLAEQTERDAIASGVKMEFARKDKAGRSTLRKVLKDSRTERELGAMQQRLALTEGRKDAQADSTGEVLPADDSDTEKGKKQKKGEE
jgi:phage shock protein A